MHIISSWQIFDQSFKIIFQGVSKKIWSGHENLTDGWTDGGHDIIQPVFDGCIKITENYASVSIYIKL